MKIEYLKISDQMNDLENRTKALEGSVEELIDEVANLQERVIKLEVKK